MSAVCVLAPVVISAWPAFSTAVVAAAASLGYVVAADTAATSAQFGRQNQEGGHRVNLEIAQSELVTGQLGRDQRISVSRDGVTVTFSRDSRGKAALCVVGEGRTDAELRVLGEELSKRVVQKYVYQRLIEEMRARQFVVVEEETDANQAIHLRIRHWEN